MSTAVFQIFANAALAHMFRLTMFGIAYSGWTSVKMAVQQYEAWQNNWLQRS